LAFEVTRVRNSTTRAKAMVMATCELVTARCTVPITGRATSPKSRPGRAWISNCSIGSATGLSLLVFVVEGDGLRFDPVRLRLRHQPVGRAARHVNRQGEAQKDSADDAPRRGSEKPVRQEPQGQSEKHAAEQVGDDLPGLVGHG